MKLFQSLSLPHLFSALIVSGGLLAPAYGDTLASRFFGDHVVQNGLTPIKGNLWTLQHVYYSGDLLDIRIEFPRGAELLAARQAEAHIVIFTREGAVFDKRVPAAVGSTPRIVWQIPRLDIDELPEGQYQLGLVVTKPGGDARVLQDWYGGFRAVLDSEAIYVAATPIASDADLDGEQDDDRDGDGIYGEENDEVDDESMP